MAKIDYENNIIKIDDAYVISRNASVSTIETILLKYGIIEKNSLWYWSYWLSYKI